MKYFFSKTGRVFLWLSSCSYGLSHFIMYCKRVSNSDSAKNSNKLYFSNTFFTLTARKLANTVAQKSSILYSTVHPKTSNDSNLDLKPTISAKIVKIYLVAQSLRQTK